MEQNLSHLSVLKYVEGFALGYFTLKVQKLPQRQETHPEPTPGDLPSCQQRGAGAQGGLFSSCSQCCPFNSLLNLRLARLNAALTMIVRIK